MVGGGLPLDQGYQLPRSTCAISKGLPSQGLGLEVGWERIEASSGGGDETSCRGSSKGECSVRLPGNSSSGSNLAGQWSFIPDGPRRCLTFTLHLPLTNVPLLQLLRKLGPLHPLLRPGHHRRLSDLGRLHCPACLQQSQHSSPLAPFHQSPVSGGRDSSSTSTHFLVLFFLLLRASYPTRHDHQLNSLPRTQPLREKGLYFRLVPTTHTPTFSTTLWPGHVFLSPRHFLVA